MRRLSESIHKFNIKKTRRVVRAGRGNATEKGAFLGQNCGAIQEMRLSAISGALYQSYSSEGIYNFNIIKNTESCPSWPKEHDWKSCNGKKPFVGSNPMLSAKERQTSVCCSFFIKKASDSNKEGGAKRRKKTVRWTVFADVATSRHRRRGDRRDSAGTKSHALRQRSSLKKAASFHFMIVY